MKTRSFATILTSLILVVPFQSFAQYWGERVMEKGFEQTDFFFVPSNLNPFGIGSFKSTTPGLFDDPLLNLAVNPAEVRFDSLGQGYLYTDFRSARTIVDQNPGYVMPWVSYATTSVAIRPYPWFYLNTRRELEPVFSGAYFMPPLPETVPNLVLGVTYQLILQDEKYYDVPQDIYRSVPGTDFAGNSVAAGASIPIVDRTSGQDNMHEKGHFITAFGGYDIPFLGSIGIKAGRVLFDRSGAFGSSNFWGYPSQNSGTSLWSNLESRSQNYNHWELTGGAQLHVNEKTSIGATAGWLWGLATQTTHNNDSSYYNYSSTTDYSLYANSDNTLQTWRHDGHTFLYGFDITSHLSPRHVLHVLYQRQRATVDIGLSTGILDTSFSSYSYTYLDTARLSSSNSFLRDQRSGSGQQIATSDRFLASMQWQIDDRTRLSFGVQFDWQRSEINTSETVLATMASFYQSAYGSYTWNYGSSESKDLLWSFSAEHSNFQIPIFVTIKASEALEVLLGLNRSMMYSKVDEVTLALFRSRQSNSNGIITQQDNFGERYTTPTEELSDVRTTFLAGITAAASTHFRVRLMVVPDFHDTFEGSKLEDLRWWISLNIIP